MTHTLLPSSAAFAAGPAAGASILVIDDDDSVRDVIDLALTHAGHRVTTMSSGAAAIAAFRDVAPDLVITDMLMPDKDGLEMITALRRLDAGVRIMAISGGGRYLGAVDVLRAAQLMGVRQVLLKPFGMRELSAMVEAELGRPAAAAVS
ncbi:MAG: response regulator [Opitutaceae bacterium]|nr:response regulator [Opitutaceae bacterium]